jgi:hypothetical protein
MKRVILYRGVSNQKFDELQKKGIPQGTVFTTDPFMAKKHGDRLIGIKYSKTGFVPTKDNNTFKLLKINEKYYINKTKMKRFMEIGEV